MEAVRNTAERVSMKNYICINGKKSPLTEQQMKKLGVTSAESPIKKLMEAVRNSNARELYKVHDIVEIGDMELEIIGFDHDKVSRDEALPTVTLMAKTLLPARRMHSGACERGWIDTELRKWLNHEYFYGLPAETQACIHRVTKYTHDYKGNMHETADLIFVPSESELFGSAIWSDYEDGPRYEAFATRNDRMRYDAEGESDWYWTRSAYGGNSTHFTYVSGNGIAGHYVASYAIFRVPLCFVVA